MVHAPESVATRAREQWDLAPVNDLFSKDSLLKALLGSAGDLFVHPGAF